jgi:hypothetical protein
VTRLHVSIKSFFLAFTPDGAQVTLDPSIITKANGDSLSFTINQTAAFFIRGSLNFDHNSFNATITQLPSGQLVKNGTYGECSRWLEFDAILYFATGLDPSSSYNVSIQNVGAGEALGVRGLDLIQVGVTGYVSSII